MGNICVRQDQAPCTQDSRAKLYQTNQLNVTQKDFVQLKYFKITQQYTLLSPPIGKGTFGSVYKAIHRSSGIIRAAKKISKKDTSLSNMDQYHLLKKLDHPNIIRVLDIFVEQDFIYIVNQFCTGGQLFDRIVQEKSFTQNNAKNYMKQILSAVSYCHSNKIMHRDLKPENIMFTSKGQNSLKLIDFGASTVYNQYNTTKTKVGSIFYIAPEVLKKMYTEKCDIWSMGVILYIMLSGCPPFNGRTDKAIQRKILVGQVYFPQQRWKRISPQAKDLIIRMMQYDPQKRISARQALNHPWFLSKSVNSGSQNLYNNKQLGQMIRFRNANKFQQSVLTFISHHLLAFDKIKALQNKFKSMDKNNDGKLSWKEFRECYIKTIGQSDEKQLYLIFEKLDKNNSGYIDYSEFIVSAFQKQSKEGKQLLQKAFKIIDRDGNEFLDKEEILFAFGGIQQELHEVIIKQCDLNNDGVISLQQFMIAMSNVQNLKLSLQKKQRQINNEKSSYNKK